MRIGQAAELSNLTIKTVRYYANIDLVKPQKNEYSGYREYTIEEVSKLKFIGRARKFDFSIKECKELLSLYEDKNRTSKDVKKITLEKLLQIDSKLKDLNELRNELNYLATSCNGDDRPNCPILDELSKNNWMNNSITFIITLSFIGKIKTI